MAVRDETVHDEQQPVAGRAASVVRDPHQRPVREIEALLQRRAVRDDEARRIVRHQVVAAEAALHGVRVRRRDAARQRAAIEYAAQPRMRVEQRTERGPQRVGVERLRRPNEQRAVPVVRVRALQHAPLIRRQRERGHIVRVRSRRQRPQAIGQVPEGRAREEILRVDRPAGPVQLRDGAQHQDGVAAQPEVVVVAADPLQPQHVAQHRQQRAQRRRVVAVRGRVRQHRRRYPLAIDLVAGRLRQRRHDCQRMRHQMRGRDAAQRAQPLARRLA
ncbi:hypothetical protein BCCR75501_06948 [Burkholderia sola]|nr:hypothetical protein BCCR75501_06948 [Burkholderia cenocepacia]